MYRVLLIDSDDLLARLAEPSLTAYIEAACDLYERYPADVLGFARDELPVSQTARISEEWEKTVTSNSWQRTGYDVLDFFYTVSLRIYQERTLQNAHVSTARTNTVDLADPRFPYDRPVLPEALNWEVLLITTRPLPATLTQIPGVRVPLQSRESKRSRTPSARTVPRVAVRTGVNFTNLPDSLRSLLPATLTARVQRLPGRFPAQPQDLF